MFEWYQALNERLFEADTFIGDKDGGRLLFDYIILIYSAFIDWKD